MEKRSVRIEIQVTADEAAEIREAARMESLPPATFVRLAAVKKARALE